MTCICIFEKNLQCGSIYHDTLCYDTVFSLRGNLYVLYIPSVVGSRNKTMVASKQSFVIFTLLLSAPPGQKND